MREFELYFSDLNDDAKARLLDFYGYQKASEGNLDLDIIPICTLVTDAADEVISH